MPTKKSTVVPQTKAARPKAVQAPVASSLSTLSSSKTNIKRTEKDESKQNKVYTIISGGGIWYKLRQNDITIFDEESKQVRQLRYSPNENSIWADEQSENIIREQIVFQAKNLIVPYTKPNLQKYLDLHP